MNTGTPIAPYLYPTSITMPAGAYPLPSRPNPKLKPCPFCGAKARAGYVTFGSQGNWSIVCTKNDRHRMEFFGPKREVIEEWNKRVNE